jgi:2-polyprenyl-6-methoxyphenol hydroxylase-like FAD-dependent oxidoreductase
MKTDVVVVGAGPVGLMLAGELRLGGVNVVVCEQRVQPSGESRGVGFTRRAAEVFDQRGLLSRLGDIEIGRESHFGGIRIDSDLLDDNHFGVRGITQHRIEAMLESWVGELGGNVLRGQEVVDLRQSDDGVVVTIEGSDGRSEISCQYLVGCDGARSTIRRLAGIDFPGRGATRGMYVADIVGRNIRPRAIGERVPGGMVMAVKLEEGVDRIVIHPDVLPPQDVSRLTFGEIADSWQSLTGESLHGAEVRWISAFTDTTRQAADYRRGRVFLAGDSAHIHIPAGAQGLSVGVQDAVNLGWKLAATIKGQAPASLLDTYHTERHPVGERVLNNTLAQASLYLTGEETEPLRNVMRELVTNAEVARRLVGKVSGLDVCYDMHLSDGHALIGFRASPDWDLELASGHKTRVGELLRTAQGVLISTDDSDEVARIAAGYSDRVQLVTANWASTYDDDRQTQLTAMLIRPDGYIAWAAPGCGDIRQALELWFGQPLATAGVGS